MCSLLRKSVFVCLIVSLLISGAISTSHSSNKIKLEKEVGIVVPVAGVTDMPNEVTLRMYNSNTAALPLTSQTFLRGEYSAYYNIIKSDGLTEMNVVKFEIKFTNFDKFLDYLDIVKKTENFWIEVDFDGKLIGQREQLDRQTTNQILATVNAQTADTSDPSSAQSAAQTGSSSTSGTNYQSGSSLVKGTSQGTSQMGSAAATILPNVAGFNGMVQYNSGGAQAGASQFYYNELNHRVGIGTAIPGAKLGIALSDTNAVITNGIPNLEITNTDQTNNNFTRLMFNDAPGGDAATMLASQITNHANNYGNFQFWTRGLNSFGVRMMIDESGKVGIGTTTPATTLSVAVSDANTVITNGMANFELTNTNQTNNNFARLSFNDASGGDAAAMLGVQTTNHTNNYGNFQFWTRGASSYGVRMLIDESGNVGIGTMSPCSDCKLAVNGKIRAKEIVVDTGWSDFVFYDNYALMPLQEVEKFIKEKQHLPGIPTAADVEKEGVSLGTISAKLLQKIEELTLYVIDLKKENHALKGDLAVLQKQMNIK